jgi:hypothetical protein
MLSFHPVQVNRDLNREDPLYVGHYFDLKGMWWKKRKQRQGLVISIALGWYRLFKRQRSAPGFIEEETLITNLTRQVKDAKVILQHFFEIKRVGFNFNDGNKSPTIISPKKLNRKIIKSIEGLLNEVHFDPGPAPTDKKLTVTTVPVLRKNAASIKLQLRTEKREDLLATVSWLIERDTVDFFYKPSGKLQARDTSVWPIRAIEMWPGWLRKELFGRVVDIENSYCQFIINNLYSKYSHSDSIIQLKYPDLFRADRDKHNFRAELCRDLLKLPINDDNISVVKRLIMALANGSNATPALMTNGSGRSEAVRIVLEANPTLKPSELVEIGKRLSFIAKQFRAAKKELCIYLLNAKPTAANTKRIFSVYFEWEREQRYKIWEAVGRTGLHLHDGIDGVINHLSDEDLEKLIVDQTAIRVSVESPELIEV